ncbi:MAG TPA: hypothetical protein VFQ25_11250 [Ktedonobacterales bacterium]|nr:hypothetical protein [Ktedonobacterales bacterium]
MATLPELDVAPLVSDARPVARAATEVYIRHTRRWLIGLMAHGSALKGGFIPGCSDVDMQLFLTEDAFDSEGRLPLALGLAIQRDLAGIPLGPFQYIQCYARSPRPRDRMVGPIPGAYHMVLGSLPVPEASAEDLRVSARRTLAGLRPTPDYIESGLLTYSKPRLERHARLMCTDVWPLIFQVLSLTESDPIAMWRLPKTEAIAYLPFAMGLRHEAAAFLRAVRDGYAGEQAPERLIAVIAQGITFRAAAADWYREQAQTASAPATRA